MAGPDFIYAVYSAAADTTNLVTPTLTPTPVNGDVLVIKTTTWDTGNPMGAITGGGQSYTNRITVAPGGFNGWCRITYTTITGSPGAFAVTGAGTAANSRHSMVVEHYLAANGYSLAATPAINATTSGAASAPSASITTVGPGSVLTWCITDVQSIDPATRAPLLSGTEDGLFDGHVGANSVQYFYYATVAAPGAFTIGLSAPGGQTWVMAGMEVLFSVASASTTPSPIVVPPAAVTRSSTW